MKHTICTKEVAGAQYKAMIFRMLFIILFSNFVSAQSNLVSNGDFENAFCPSALTQISQASPWNS